MDLSNQHIVVVGLARSGLAVARFLAGQGARVTISDQSTAGGIGPFVEEARKLAVNLELGGHRLETFTGADLIVISPGVPHTIRPVVKARRHGVPVIGEIELAGRYLETPIVAVTGTNGKTTATELLGRMLAASGLKVFVGGNIGNPLIDIVNRPAPLDIVVAEVSSFQLDTIDTFRPTVGVLLNISPDHLDRYADIKAYADAKGRLFANQRAGDVAIFNGDDPLSRNQMRGVASQRMGFYVLEGTDARPGGNGAFIRPHTIEIRMPDIGQVEIDLSATRLIGPHNRQNTAAAAMAALAAGASNQGIQSALDQFHGLPHRLETVGSVNGIFFVNDSKATNVDAVARALECFDTPIVLIIGGRNKGYDFTSLSPPIRRHVRKLVVIGEASAEILAALGDAPAQGTVRAASMEEAVHKAYTAARPGETVLLSPACASFDMFGNYAERGDVFRRIVEQLK